MKSKTILQILLTLFLLLSCSSKSDPAPTESPMYTIDPNGVQIVEIPVNRNVILDEMLTILFSNVTEDSRCPEGAECIWMGDGEVNLKLSTPAKQKYVKLHTALEPRNMYFENYYIELVELNPYPQVDEVIDPKNYEVKLKVTYGISGNEITMISFDQSDFINRDQLDIKDLRIENDSLKSNISYSGGCKEHEIQLYGFKEIMESQPPQMEVRFSHNANNDLCEAYLTEQKSFDLTPLINFLKDSGIDEIILNIYKPDSETPIEQLLFIIN